MRARARRWRRLVAIGGVAVMVMTLWAWPAAAGGGTQTLAHIGTFFVPDNLPGDPTQPTSAEIVDVTSDSQLMVYTDALASRVGFVDVSDPRVPTALGSIEVDGGPTSVAILRDRWALVLVDTSASFTEPGGNLLVLDLATRAVVRTIPLAGQPDSIAISPKDHRFAAIVIENQRDEDTNDGFLPQLPAGLLQVLELKGQPSAWTVRDVSLTGLAAVAPEDPEPEYVDINRRDQAVVTLQENNHLVIVDLRKARVVRHFSAGSVTVTGIDATEDGLGPQGNGVIRLDETLTDRRREPDAVQWIDDDTFATANEGDYVDAGGVEGGSRSFTLFNATGRVEWESGSKLEHEIVRAGHYPEARSENKGSEPEGLEVAHYRGQTLLFVAAERANVVAVYDVTRGRPSFVQLLPTGIGPEGLKFTRNGLLAVTAEVDGADEGFLARPIITLFRVGRPTYPDLTSVNDANGRPIPWVAISGLAGDPKRAGTVWAVSDSVLAQAYLYRVDVSGTPARITQRIPIGGVDVEDTLGDFDLEGVAARRQGGFWFASEGRVGADGRPNLLVRTNQAGVIQESIALPPALAAGMTSSGFEGLAVTREDGEEVIYVAIQGRWPAAGDPANMTKIGRYEVGSGWTFAHYPLDTTSVGTIGLSEITLLPDGSFAIVERDNQLGQQAQVKRIYGVDLSDVVFAPYGSTLPVLTKHLLRDVLGDLDAASISVPDKLEGLAVTAGGQLYLATDNDGVDENYGETLFFKVGRWSRVLD